MKLGAEKESMSIKLHVYVGPYAECEGVGISVSWGDMIGEVEKDLTVAIDENHSDNTERWIPNREFRHSVTFDPYSDNKIFPIVGNVANHRDEFEDEFHDALEVLRKRYGYENVRLKYGALPYWS